METMETTNNQEALLKQKIELVENSNLDDQDKLELILFLLDRKQGLQIGDLQTPDKENKEEVEKSVREMQAELEETLQVLREVGSPYRIIKEISTDNGAIGFSILMAKDKKTLEEFIKAKEENDEEKFGLILGNPPTSFNLHGTEEAFSLKEESVKNPRFEEKLPELEEEGLLPFISFIPSEENWQEELAWARENKRQVEMYAPALSQRLTEDQL